jgi:2-deoxy-D-gluconate 3-dehydrogenase
MTRLRHAQADQHGAMDHHPFDLGGRVALVTGARSGIGQGIAIALARAGADIVGIGRGAMDGTAQAVTDLGRRFHGIVADVADIDDGVPLVEQAAAAFGRLDILVNNAGTTHRQPAIEVAAQDWDRVMDTNLRSTFLLAQAAARRFRAQGGGGRIIAIASMLSFQGGINVAAYAASKSGVAGLVRALANEWAAEGINVNAIAPGYIATELTQAIQDDPARNPAIMARIPAARWGKPADLGGMAVFLASDAAGYCHGGIYPVDGGWLGR